MDARGRGPLLRRRRRQTLITLLLVVIVGFLVWRFVAPGEQFLPGFASILTEATIQRGPFSFFSGRSYLRGKFQGRDVAIRLQLKRSRYGQGYLVVAVRTGGEPTLNYAGIESRTRDDAGRRALSSIVAHDLLPSVEEGWLKVLWQPQGFVIFPGSFSAEKWRQVLEATQTLAASLEGASQDFSPEIAEDA